MLNGIVALHGTGVAAATNSYESIATVTVGSGGSSSISFTSIPSGYKHLQVRGIFLYSNTGDNLYMTYNSGSFSNVRSHYMFGNGSTVTAGTDTTNGGVISINGGNSSTAFEAVIYDFLDYTDTNKTHTLRYLNGHDINAAGGVMALGSAIATNQSAITGLSFQFAGGSNFREFSQFALYGIKG